MLHRVDIYEKIECWLSICLKVIVLLQAELRASVFEAIEEEDKIIENEDGLPPALLGSCNERAKQLHNSPSGNFSFRYQIFFLVYESFDMILKSIDNNFTMLFIYLSKSAYRTYVYTSCLDSSKHAEK